MSLSSILGIARSALIAHRQAMQVTAHNVANAMTPGYSRQRLELAQVGPASGGIGLSSVGLLLGQGVTAAALTRIRDPFLDGSYRDESANLGLASTLRQYLEQIEGQVGEPSDQGIASALDGLFNSFSELANDPSNSIPREQVRSAAQRLVRLFHQLDGQLQNAEEQAVAQMNLEVADVNRLSEQIAGLNAKILALSAGDSMSPDLLDQRDRLLDELSSYLSVDVRQAEDGTLSVMAGGAMLVAGTMHEQLVVEGTGPGAHVALEGGRGVVDPEAGSLAALVDLVGTRIPALREKLDQLAANLVSEMNAIHRTGTTLSGQTGTDFFDPSGVTAGTIQLTAAIEGSTDAIAASGSGGPGDNAVALQLAGLGGAAIGGLGGSTFASFYAAFSGALGVETRAAQQDEEAAAALFDHADSMRTSVAGVSVDEEMVNLITQQEAYQAAARLITVADEMIQVLLDSV